MQSNYCVVHKDTAVFYKFRQGQGVVLVENIWYSFARELLASIPGPGFDVQIGTVQISVIMKLFQDKCVAVTIMVRKNPDLSCTHLNYFYSIFPHFNRNLVSQLVPYFLIIPCYVHKKQMSVLIFLVEKVKHSFLWQDIPVIGFHFFKV